MKEGKGLLMLLAGQKGKKSSKDSGGMFGKKEDEEDDSSDENEDNKYAEMAQELMDAGKEGDAETFGDILKNFIEVVLGNKE